MSDNGRKPKTYSLRAIKRKFKESHPEYGELIPFTITDGGEEFHLQHPLFQTDETTMALKKAMDGTDQIGMAKALLGDQWDAFKAAGGQSSDVMLLYGEIAKDTQDSDGEGNPTRR